MSETPIMSPPFTDHHIPPEWLIALSKAAASLRFTASSWTWMTESAVRESLRIADTLTEMQNAFHVDSQPSSRSMLMDGTDGAYYVDQRPQILLRDSLSYKNEYMAIGPNVCMYVANKLRYGCPKLYMSTWLSTIRDLMLAGF